MFRPRLRHHTPSHHTAVRNRDGNHNVPGRSRCAACRRTYGHIPPPRDSCIVQYRPSCRGPNLPHRFHAPFSAHRGPPRSCSADSRSRPAPQEYVPSGGLDTTVPDRVSLFCYPTLSRIPYDMPVSATYAPRSDPPCTISTSASPRSSSRVSYVLSCYAY